jgi:hypothetical protein
MIASLVYLLCAVTSATCTWMLASKFRETKAKLLFWSAICFFGFTISNVVLFIDIVLLPTIDLFVLRTLPALIGALSLTWGLISEST